MTGILSSGSLRLESQECLEGAGPIYTISLQNVTTVGTDYVMYVYRGSSDVTSSVTTGSMSRTTGSAPASVTTKTFQNLKVGTYVVTVFVTMDGIFDGRIFDLHVTGKSGKQ